MLVRARSASPNALAKALGLVAWTGDPQQIAQDATDGSGSIHGSAVWLQRGDVVSRIAELVAVAGVAMTHGLYGLFDSGFNMLAETADTPAAFQAAGWVDLALVTPYVVPLDGLYYVADLLAATTTMPAIGNLDSLAATNARSELPNAVWRHFTQGAALSAFPAPLVPAITGIARCFLLR